MSGKLLARLGVLSSSIVILLFGGAAVLNAKIMIDGYQSHAVGTHLKIARYEWYTGDLPGVADALLLAGSRIPEAGLRWQLAQTYFYLAHNQQLQGNPARAEQYCRQALEALDYGQYDHTRTGTSTTVNKCPVLRPKG
jgi:hypothetical protein